MRLLGALVSLSLMSTVAVVLAAPPSPEAFLGHPIGADGKLADYRQIVRYLEALDRESPRVTLERLGESTLGRPMVMAVISSEANLRDAARYRDIARRLADPRRLAVGEADRLVADGKVIVLVTCNIHSTEIGASQMALEWAWRLATDADPGTARWLDDVILLLMPSINPDGTDLVVDWYRKYAGTRWEGGRLPWLYHHYAGHDNNRDWFMLNLAETRIVNRVLHHEWFPQVFLDMHQMGATTPRIFVPPYSDPHTPLVHPLQWRMNDLIGTDMALRLEQAGKSGVIYDYAYDAYWPGGTKNTACLKNVIGLLTEVASCRVASPVYVDPGELSGGRKGLPDYGPRMNFPNPWPGGWWRLRDIVDYELVAANSLLETCAGRRAELLRAFHDMGRDAIERGTHQAPFAYVIPARQHDAYAAAALVDVMLGNGVEARVAERELDAGDGRRFPAGSVVFLAAQPYRPFLIEMMERQRFPEVREGPDTKEIFKPYDVTAWTLPLLMGVEWARVDGPFTGALAPLEHAPWPAGGVEAGANAPAALVVRASSSGAAPLVNGLLAAGVRMTRATAAFAAGGRWYAPGDFMLPASAAARADALGREHHVDVERLAEEPAVVRRALRAPRIGVYKPWAASIDEGWTRLVLDRYGFHYRTLDNAAIARGNLEARFDAIVLPSVARAVIVDGTPKSDDGPQYREPLPPPYDGGIGKDGVASLKRFVERGGTLICLSESCALPLEDFNLPVRDVLAKVKASEFSMPGTLANLTVDPSQPLAYGLPERVTAYLTGGPAFATSIPGAGVERSVVARYPAYADEVVASGWGLGADKLTDRAAVVETRLQAGRVVLFGPRVQNRAWTMGTFKLLFNALYLAGRVGD